MTRFAQEGEQTRRTARKSKKIQLTTVINCSNDEKFLMLKEKNRESAQRSRDNKKRYVMNLQAKISQLQLQNDYLRGQLNMCRCNRSQETAQDNTAAASEEDPKIVEENSESSFFQRVSVKSFASCSNFLILSLVMMFCVFGFVDVTGEGHKSHGELYSHDHVMTAVARWAVPAGSCEGAQVPTPPKFNIPDGRPPVQIGGFANQSDLHNRTWTNAPEPDLSPSSPNVSKLIRSK